MSELKKKPFFVVEKFFGFLDLHTSNKVIAWIHFVFCIIFVVVFVILFLMALYFGQAAESIDEYEIQYSKGYSKQDVKEVKGALQMFAGFGALILFICIVVCGLLAWIPYLYIQGINTQQPSKMLAFLIFEGLGTIGNVINMFTGIFGVILCILYIYIFVCAFSSYWHLKNNPDFQQTQIPLNTGANMQVQYQQQPQQQQYQSQYPQLPQTSAPPPPYSNQGACYEGSEQKQASWNEP